MTDRVAQAVANRSGLANLPFARKIDGEVVFWLVEPSGDWIADCVLGDRCARIFMRLITGAGQPCSTYLGAS